MRYKDNTNEKECLKNLCIAVINCYLTTLLLRPLDCYRKGCPQRRCLKNNGEICTEKAFFRYKKLFEKSEETPYFWFYGAEMLLLFDKVKEIYKKSDCLADAREKLKLEKNRTISGFHKKKHSLYKIFSRKNNTFLFETTKAREVANKLNSSVGVVNNTALKKQTYLSDDYIITREIL